jgi:hypothetical protein
VTGPTEDVVLDYDLTAVAMVEAFLDRRYADASALTVGCRRDGDLVELISALTSLACNFVELAAGMQGADDQAKAARRLLAHYRRIALDHANGGDAP